MHISGTQNLQLILTSINMNFYSLNHQAPNVSFKDAVIKGIAPDRGLYFPELIKALPKDFFNKIEDYSDHEIAFLAIQQFVGKDIPEDALKEIIADVLDFEFPLVEIEDDVAALELFHGPTLAFKDVGARFMARCLGYFSSENTKDVTVLVATSGDTGGAVANGFLGVDGVKVVILYPSGKVSDIQEKQLTTLGKNITALEVEGTFDDCQNMVKTAFLDEELIQNMQLTSANSINVARWLPQMFYFLFAYKEMKSKGMPCKHFIASTNVNDVVPRYMDTGEYDPKASIATISNAMDVGDPSNFIRIRHLYKDNFEKLSKNISSYSFTDNETKEAMLKLYNDFTYVADPHGAVGYLGLKKYQETHPDTYGIFLETAHPVKFLDVVEDTIRENIDLPESIVKVMGEKKKSIKISQYSELKGYLLGK